MKKIIVSFGTKDELAQVLETTKADEVRFFAKNLFDGRVYNLATHVFAPNLPDIESLYEEAGKQVLKEKAPVAAAPSVQAEPVDDEPKHWSELSWPKLRSLATEFTDESVKSKEQAQEILEEAEKAGKV